MEFLILLFIGWILWSAVGNAAKNARARLPPPAFWDPSQVPPEHVRQVGAVPAAALPVFGESEESTSELMWDEAAGDTELDASGQAPTEVVALEAPAGMSVEARPLPGVAVSLEQEVNWEAEHERFHHRYVDGHSPGSAARHGLLDEMRDPGALRRAVLMAEILGPPRSLRKQS